MQNIAKYRRNLWNAVYCKILQNIAKYSKISQIFIDCLHNIAKYCKISQIFMDCKNILDYLPKMTFGLFVRLAKKMIYSEKLFFCLVHSLYIKFFLFSRRNGGGCKWRNIYERILWIYWINPTFNSESKGGSLYRFCNVVVVIVLVLLTFDCFIPFW